MTKYTDNRRYPYPDSPREAGNGGLHSELLARAVAADLDDIDAQWAAEAVHSTATLQMTSDHVGSAFSNADNGIFFDGVEHASGGFGLFTYAGAQTLQVAKGGDGWYHVTGSIRAGASGTVTAAARHELTLRRSQFRFGKELIVETYLTNTFQAGTADIAITVEAVMHLVYNDQLSLHYFHTNASAMTVRQAGTNLGATLIFKG